MRVYEIMTANPITVKIDDSLRVAIKRMRENNCRRLPVINKDGALVGIISDRDTRLALDSPYITHAHSEHNAIEQLSVRQAMTPAPMTVEPTTDVIEVIRLMVTYQIGGLPVLRDESLVGIVTSSDLLMAFVRYLRSNPQTVVSDERK